MKIKITNDGKGKHQSAEASLECFVTTPNGSASVTLTGYGADEGEALSNLRDVKYELTVKMTEAFAELSE